MGTVQTFSACLREILNRRGISASELSRRMGFSSRTSVFRLLNGETSHEKQREFVKRLEELCERLHAEFEASCRGLEANVLWEGSEHGGKMYGYTDNYIRLCRDYAPMMAGRIEKVTI